MTQDKQRVNGITKAWIFLGLCTILLTLHMPEKEISISISCIFFVIVSLIDIVTSKP